MVLLRLYTNRDICMHIYYIRIYNSIRLSIIEFSCLKIVSPVGGESGCAYYIPDGYFNDPHTDSLICRNNSESTLEDQIHYIFHSSHKTIYYIHLIQCLNY